MGYQAVGFGPDDLRLSAAELYAILSPVEGQETPFVSANVGLYSMDDKTVPRFRVFEVGGKKIGVTSVVGDDYRRKVNNNDIQFKPAAEALAEVVPELQKAKCDVLVLLSNAKLDESTALAKKFPQFNFVLSAGGADEPPDHPMLVEGTQTRLIEVGHKGQYAIVIGLFDDAKQPVRYQRVPLDARWGESDRMKQVMASYQDQLKEQGLNGLGLKPVKHPSGREFIGSQAVRRVPYQGVCHLEEDAALDGAGYAGASESAAAVRSGMPELPRDGLGAAEIFSLCRRISEHGEDAAVGRQRLRELPRAGLDACGGGAGRVESLGHRLGALPR